jgi:hypothetical protein
MRIAFSMWLRNAGSAERNIMTTIAGPITFGKRVKKNECSK